MKRIYLTGTLVIAAMILGGCANATNDEAATVGRDVQFGQVQTPTPVPLVTPKPRSAAPSSVTIPGQTFLGTPTAQPTSQPNNPSSNQAAAAAQKEVPMNSPIPDATELQITDQVVGTGAEAASGQKVTVHYDGYLTNGTMFDSSRQRGTPFSFNLGSGQVIQGWDQGVAGMKVGGKRRLIIPPDLGYGAQGAGAAIPPNATLIFDVELLQVE